MPKKIRFYQKPTCTTCRKSKAYLEKRGANLELRNLDTERLSESELDELIGKRDHREFLNTRNELYRSRKMKDNPPTRAEAIKLMAANPNLIRRPVTISGTQIILGYDEPGFKKLASSILPVPNEVPSTDPRPTIALVGATAIAEQIASRALRSGLNVVIDDVSDARLETISRSLHGLHSAPALTQSVESAIRAADFLIDTLPDDLEVKLELFTLFDKFAKPSAIFITTGSIAIDDLAAITFCPDRCIAVRLSNVANTTDVTVELFPATESSRQTVATCTNLFVHTLGFRAARV
jgi:Spx/MgsR family transcriptional regulator